MSILEKGHHLCGLCRDTIFAGPNRALIDAEIQGLGVSSKEQSHYFDLRD
jgi:hypothetical protein